jgi:hypothetical protein
MFSAHGQQLYELAAIVLQGHESFLVLRRVERVYL